MLLWPEQSQTSPASRLVSERAAPPASLMLTENGVSDAGRAGSASVNAPSAPEVAVACSPVDARTDTDAFAFAVHPETWAPRRGRPCSR